MTLGEKLARARKENGLSQEGLAEKLCVSRSAVAKWETDKGIPDVANLKAISKLLNVSVDYLLDDEEVLDLQVIRESYDLSKYGKGIRKRKKDRVILEKFPDATIHTLLGKQVLTKGEKTVDFMVGFFTSAPFGIPELLNSLKHVDKEFYLVEKEGKQYLVMVTDEFIETRQLTKIFTEKKFRIGTWEFVKCAYEPKP